MLGMLGIPVDDLHGLGIVAPIGIKGGFVGQNIDVHILFQPLQVIDRFIGEHEDAVLCQVNVNGVPLRQHGKNHIEQNNYHQKRHGQGGGKAAVSQLAVG